jgi:hypothetical protein
LVLATQEPGNVTGHITSLTGMKVVNGVRLALWPAALAAGGATAVLILTSDVARQGRYSIDGRVQEQRTRHRHRAVPVVLAMLARRWRRATPRFGAGSIARAADRTRVLSVPVRGDPSAERAVAAVRELRSTIVPAAFAGTGAEALVGGRTSENIDYFDSVIGRRPS